MTGTSKHLLKRLIRQTTTYGVGDSTFITSLSEKSDPRCFWSVVAPTNSNNLQSPLLRRLSSFSDYYRHDGVEDVLQRALQSRCRLGSNDRLLIISGSSSPQKKIVVVAHPPQQRRSFHAARSLPSGNAPPQPPGGVGDKPTTYNNVQNDENVCNIGIKDEHSNSHFPSLSEASSSTMTTTSDYQYPSSFSCDEINQRPSDSDGTTKDNLLSESLDDSTASRCSTETVDTIRKQKIQSFRLKRRLSRIKQHVESAAAAAADANGSPHSSSDSSRESSGTSSQGHPNSILGSSFVRSLYALGLYRKPAFPGFYQILQIQDQQVVEFLTQLKEGGVQEIGGFLTKDENEQDGPGSTLRRDAGAVSSLSSLHETGTLLTIVNIVPHVNLRGGQVVVMPQKRIRRLSDPGNFVQYPNSNEILVTQSTPTSSVDEHQQYEPHELIPLIISDVKLSNNTSSLSTIDSPATQSPLDLSETTSILTSVENQRDQSSYNEPSNVTESHNVSIVDDTFFGETTRLLRAAAEDELQSNPLGTLASEPNSNPLKLKGDRLSHDAKDQLVSSKSTTTLSPPLFEVVAQSCDTAGQQLRFDSTETLKAVHSEIVATMHDLLKSSLFYKEHFEQVVKFYNLDYPAKLADLVAGMSFAKRDELQAVLEELEVEKRSELVLEIIKKDFEFSKLQNRVKSNVEANISKEQKKYLLTEQLKFLKQELGLDKDDKHVIIKKLQEAIENKIIPAEADKTIQHELGRLSALDPSSAEFNICRTYLEWLTQMPWGLTTVDNEDIKKAADILDVDHHGLKDVKDRLLEFMAVTILKRDVQGKIICLVGPPGIGKTSIVKSMARALNRGLFDVAELRGHRRTYVGAMPGKFIQALKQTQTINPVILLDEIDKMGKDFRGDPGSALLEVLDPTQNTVFRDHYLDVPMDLSKVLFICTANSLEGIPPPLLDRMEVIRLSGYVLQEKVDIARHYLIPQVMKETGICKEKISFDDEVVQRIAQDYAREAGVRNLLKLIEKIFRKVALQIVRNSFTSTTVTMDNLVSFLGQQPFPSERLFPMTPPGVAMGLAWTELGGAVLYVECQGRVLNKASNDNDKDDNSDNSNNNSLQPTKQPSAKQHLVEQHESVSRHGSFKFTGRLGDVMSESCQIALSFAKFFLASYTPENRYLDEAQIHLHIPEGATPKDGPSAGITMACALISLALDQPLCTNLAMTGELTLTRRVLRIGGVKEKVIAARREFVKNLIFPRDNLKDYEELEENIKEGITAHFVDSYSDVFEIAFPSQLKPPKTPYSRSRITVVTPAFQEKSVSTSASSSSSTLLEHQDENLIPTNDQIIVKV